MQCLAPRETAEWRVFSPVPRARCPGHCRPWGGAQVLFSAWRRAPRGRLCGAGLKDNSPRQVPRSNLNCTFLIESRRHGGPTRRVQTGVGTVQVKGRGALEHREVEIPSRAHGW